ncbi:MAG: hypothetical protein JSW65_06705 [Candidatus Bipolaricaulota bacterium]|nr:MAG: hypothetical protein JSW65_06705 [Candidatus Bipolaricaulota bacterium]
MKRGIASVVVVAVCFVAIAAMPALAARPLRVHIEVPTALPTGSTPDPFIASGPAVDRGLLCATGDVYTGPISWRPIGGSSLALLSMVKTFECDDGSGTFDVNLVVVLDLSTGVTRGSWRVIGGTGSYASLSGWGRLKGIPTNPGVVVLDLYDGMLR